MRERLKDASEGLKESSNEVSSAAGAGMSACAFLVRFLGLLEI
jgi:hypothetical protein